MAAGASKRRDTGGSTGPAHWGGASDAPRVAVGRDDRQSADAIWAAASPDRVSTKGCRAGRDAIGWARMANRVSERDPASSHAERAVEPAFPTSEAAREDRSEVRSRWAPASSQIAAFAGRRVGERGWRPPQPRPGSGRRRPSTLAASSTDEGASSCCRSARRAQQARLGGRSTASARHTRRMRPGHLSTMPAATPRQGPRFPRAASRAARPAACSARRAAGAADTGWRACRARSPVRAEAGRRGAVRASPGRRY